jgi:hypothetical protein
MSKTSAILLLSASALALTGCDWFGGGSTADTEMKNVEILPGTASDEMITLDQASGDGTAIDGSTAIGPTVPGAADSSDDDDEDATDDDTSTSSDDSTEAPEAGSGDVVIRPPASGAEPDAPAKK